MLKCSSDRCVWAPQSLSAGTRTSPKLSASVRTALIAGLVLWFKVYAFRSLITETEIRGGCRKDES